MVVDGANIPRKRASSKGDETGVLDAPSRQ